MQDKNVFDPEKITLVDFKMIKGQVDTPENFETKKVTGHHLDNSLQLSFNLDEKLVKVDFIINITTDTKDNNNQAAGSFHLIFIYQIENLGELALLEKNNRLTVNPDLANALSSVTYSTSRGILLTRLQGTALQNFILPIVNPKKLLGNRA